MPKAKVRGRGVRVAPPGESRQQIIDWLEANGGEIVDPSGRATPKLLEEVGYAGSMGGFSALITAMARDGDIIRTVNGRRCSRIALPGVKPSKAVSAPMGRSLNSGNEDLGPLAMKLLETVVDIISSAEAPSQDSSALAEKDAEIARLSAEVAQLQAELASIKSSREDAFNALRNLRRPRQDVSTEAIKRVTARR